MKRLLALTLALLMVLSLAACGDGEKSGSKIQNAMDRSSLELGLSNEDVTMGTPTETVDPQSIFASADYDERYFFGDYRILGGEDGEKAYAESTTYVDCDLSDVYAEKITAVPYRLTAGKHTLSHKLNYVAGRNFLRAYFYTDSGNMTSNLCEYFVSGNTITLKMVDKLEYNEDYTHVRCYMSDLTFTYTFQFDGRKLTLSDGTNTVQMYSGLDVYTDDPLISIDNYLAADAPRMKGLDYLYSLFMDGGEYSRFSMENSQENNTRYGRAVMEENGLITITLPTADGESYETFQMAYIYCRDDGIILMDGTNTYFFTQTRDDLRSDALGGLSMEDAQKAGKLSEEKLAQIVQKRADLLSDLAAAFRAAGLGVTINEESGEITMDASVLFPVDGYDVSEEGKELLKQFMATYCSVVFDAKYEGFISQIMVEGHTDSDGEYSYNLTLSQNRADSVAAFCVSADCGVDAYSQQLVEMLKPIGFASDNLVRDASGNENKAASRRVAFRFVINLDN